MANWQRSRRSWALQSPVWQIMDRAVAEGKIHYDEATGSWRQGAAVKTFGREAKQTRDYLDEINTVARKTAAELPATLGKAFETLGLDFEQANGRIGESFKETLGALDTLVQHSGSSSAACEEVPGGGVQPGEEQGRDRRGDRAHAGDGQSRASSPGMASPAPWPSPMMTP